MRVALLSTVAAGWLAVASVAAFAADPVPRLTGEVSYKTYPAVAAFLFDQLEKPVAFDVTLPLDNEESDGHLTTFVLDGQFEIAFLAGPDGSRIYADTGFDLVDDDHYTLKGVFTVKPGGVQSGLPIVLLEPADNAGDLPTKDVPVDSLPAKPAG